MLFAVMVNELVNNWSLKAKFVDDLTIMEVIPRNSPRIMRHVVSDFQEFASNNNMQLNPVKCKDMRVSFLHHIIAVSSNPLPLVALILGK